MSQKRKKVTKSNALQNEVLISQIVEEALKEGLCGEEILKTVEKRREKEREQDEWEKNLSKWQDFKEKLEHFFVFSTLPTILLLTTVLAAIVCTLVGISVLYITYLILGWFFGAIAWIF